MISDDVVRLKSDIAIAMQTCTELQNSVKSYISFMNRLTELECNYVSDYTDSINQNMSKLEDKIDTVYKVTSSNLPDFLKSLNNSITKIKDSFAQIVKIILNVNTNAKELFDLVMMDIEIEGFLEYSLSLNDITKYTSDFNDFYNSLILLSKELETANTKLIVKA